MINIYEKIPSKVPGITSLFIDFDYNVDILNIIKSFPCKNYSKKTKIWELPI